MMPPAKGAFSTSSTFVPARAAASRRTAGTAAAAHQHFGGNGLRRLGSRCRLGGGDRSRCGGRGDGRGLDEGAATHAWVVLRFIFVGLAWLGSAELVLQQ